MDAPTPFDRALALGFIGAAANGTDMEKKHENLPEQAGGFDPGTGGRGRDAEPSTVYLRTCDVRAVRRETRTSKAANGQVEAVPVVVVDFVASDESIDSHGSIVTCDHDLKRFNKNPVLLWSHNRDKDDLPIGKCENTRVEGGKLLSTAVFFMRTEAQREIAEAYARDECRMFSIGFMPGTFELREVNDEEVLILSNNVLLEISAVPVGSNENALAQKALEAARVKARTAKSPTPEPIQQRATAPTAKPGAPKDLTMKTLTIDVRAQRATNGHAACPACNEALALALTNIPEPDEKALNEATTRASTAEGKAKEHETKVNEATRALALVTSELDAAKARIAAMEPELAAARTESEKQQRAVVEAEVDKRVGHKVFAAERNAEVKHLLALLANRTADDTSKDEAGKATRTIGEKDYAERLALLDARPDIGLLGAPITDNKPNSGMPANPEARSLAAEIDALLAKQIPLN